MTRLQSSLNNIYECVRGEAFKLRADGYTDNEINEMLKPVIIGITEGIKVSNAINARA